MVTNFKQVLFHEETSVFYVLYTVTFSKPSATCLHKYAWRGLTETLREKYENVIIDLRNLHGIYIWSSGGQMVTSPLNLRKPITCDNP